MKTKTCSQIFAILDVGDCFVSTSDLFLKEEVHAFMKIVPRKENGEFVNSLCLFDGKYVYFREKGAVKKIFF